MKRDLKARYGFGSWGERRGGGERLLVQGFDPWKKDCMNWRREERRALREPKQRLLRRSMWSPPGNPKQRILIEVRETASAEAAAECLLDVLGQHELKRLPNGSNDIGDVCFVHPEGQTPAIFWTTGNLCISVVSIGLKPMPVLDWARRLNARTSTKPRAQAFDLALKPSKGDLAVKKEKVVGIERPKDLSDEAFLQVFSEGADLSLKKGEIRICAAQEGPVAVEAFVVEPARPPRAGRLDLSARKTPK